MRQTPLANRFNACTTVRAPGCGSAAAVATLYRGMVRGLRTFAAFFIALTVALPQMGLMAAAAALLVATRV